MQTAKEMRVTVLSGRLASSTYWAECLVVLDSLALQEEYFLHSGTVVDLPAEDGT